MPSNVSTAPRKPAEDDEWEVVSAPAAVASAPKTDDEWERVNDWETVSAPKDSTPAPGDVAGRKAWMDKRYGNLKPAEPPKDPRSAVERYGSSLWDTVNPVPVFKALGESMPPAKPITEWSAGDVARTALGPAWTAIDFVRKNVLPAQADQFKQSYKALKRGNVSEAGGRAVAGALPGVGPIASRIGEQIGEGDYAGAAGTATGVIAPIPAAKAIPKVARKLANVGKVEPVDAMTRAIKPRNTNIQFKDLLDRSLPEVKASEAVLGKPISSIGDLIEAIKVAKKRVWSQWEQVAGPYREMGAQINLNPVADAMERSIPKRTQIQEPGKASSITERASTYRRKYSIQEAEDLLRNVNDELDAYYNKLPPAQRSAAYSDPTIAHQVAEAKALRKAINDTLDSPNQGAIPRELKQRYGSLMNLEEEAYRRYNVAARQAPESLSEQLGKWHAAGRVVRGAVRTVGGDVGGLADIGQAIAERKVAKVLKERNTSDSLVRRAMKDYTKQPVPIDIPPTRPPAGLLSRPPIVTPPPPDPSSVRGVPDMNYVGVPRKALPPPSPFKMPGAPDTSGVGTVSVENPATATRNRQLSSPTRGLLEGPTRVTPPPADTSGVRTTTGEPLRAPLNRQLSAGPSVRSVADLGGQTGDVTDLVPMKGPNGEIFYVPQPARRPFVTPQERPAPRFTMPR